MDMVAPALNWQPANVSNDLPEPTSKTEQRTYAKALMARKSYQDNPMPLNQIISLLFDSIHIFQTTGQQYLVMRCHEAKWKKGYSLNLLTDPLHLFIIHDTWCYDTEWLLPTDRRAKAVDYKRAVTTLRYYRGPLIHPADAFQLDHTIDYFTERERQCRGASAQRGRQARVPVAGRAWERPA